MPLQLRDSLPPFGEGKLYIIMDNTPGDNKNSYVFAMLAYLVAVGMFQEVEVIHLLKGHTHNDVDAVFGVLAKRVKHATIYTPEELMTALRSSVKKSKI